MRTRKRFAILAGLAAVFLAGCPKGNSDFKAGKKAEALQDYDTALVHYERALRADPQNAEYRLKAARLRFETAQWHVRQGQKYRDKGELTLAVAEFEKAVSIDPSSAIAAQELRRTLDLVAARSPGPAGAPPQEAQEEPVVLGGPPQLTPLSRDPINLRITNNARIVYETLAKLAGITVIFDADWQPRPISAEMTNVTLEQALDVVALQSKTFWKPVAPNVIFVIPEMAQKRKDYEDLVIKTFYLSNTIQAQDLTEITNAIRGLFELRRIQQVNAQNAIVVRDTPDKLALIEKILRDIDKAKPEVILQVTVLQARRDRARDLGIQPGSSAVLGFTPRNPTSSGGTGTGANQVRLNDLQRLSSADYSLTLPGATALALITDTTTRVIQNPEIRTVDGQSAKLRVGDKVPIATGSFQSGLGGATTGVGVINPLVNTQFQYQEVGVNVDVTPRIHANREVSMKVSVEVSSVAGRVNIGGIEQPIISQRKIEHDVRLKEGEVNVLGGLIERSEAKSISGWPGLSKIPFFRYFFSSESLDVTENEILIVLTPRLVRLPEFTAQNFATVAAGTDSVVSVRREEVPRAPAPPPAKQPTRPPSPGPGAPPPTAPPPAQTQPAETVKIARLRFDPPALNLKPGEMATLGLLVEEVKDLYAIPMLLQFSPAAIAIEEIRHGGFLSGGTQEVAIVQRIDKEKGTAIVSATRPANTSGVSGTGTLVEVVVRGVAAGSSPLRVAQINAKDAQGKAISFVTSEATIVVK
jgi:general secretion pathway protein D